MLYCPFAGCGSLLDARPTRTVIVLVAVRVCIHKSMLDISIKDESVACKWLMSF
jgi:hypothetical protein